jgi:hypothetical protein
VTRTLLLAGAERLPLYATRSVRRASGFVQVARSDNSSTGGADSGLGLPTRSGRCTP